MALALAAGCLMAMVLAAAASATPAAETAAPASTPTSLPGQQAQIPADHFLPDLEERTFRFFWETANPKNGLIPDRYPTPSFASIAGVGFALTAYPIGVERGYVSVEAAQQRVLATLRFFERETNEHGFFYHFIDMQTGARANDSEISTVDTALLLGGVLFCESYFNTPDRRDVQIRQLAERIYRRVDWTWAQPRPPGIALGWWPDHGFSTFDWRGYNEAMLVYLLALGSPTHPVSPSAWKLWTAAYDKQWGTVYNLSYLSFAPLFGYQYTHVWVDFRGIRDAFMRSHGLDYFENSRRATYAQRRYAIANPMAWQGYGRNVWGISASDGPGAKEEYQGKQYSFMHYAARGVAPGQTVDDGTIAPTAAISSLPFAPEIVLPTMLEMYHRYGGSIYSAYGFFDAFNPSFRKSPADPLRPGSPGWVDVDYIAIDQGPILAMIENYRSGLIWRLMRGNPYLQRGLERAGFSGGWLAGAPTLSAAKEPIEVSGDPSGGNR